MAYPPGTQFTTVVGKFLRTVDNVEVPAEGTVIFVPEPRVIKSLQVDGHYASVGASTSVRLVNGQIDPPVQLLSSDNINIEPRDWTYTAILDFDHLEGAYTFPVLAVSDTTLYLDTVLPANPSAGIFIGADQVLALITGINEAAADNADRAELAKQDALEAAGEANGYLAESEQVLDTLLEYLAGTGIRWFLDIDGVPAFARATDSLPPAGTPEIYWDVDNDGAPAFDTVDTDTPTPDPEPAP